jgi:Mn2+/Fe2+ NRAMP family transporter
MQTFVHFVFGRNVSKILLFSKQFNSCLPVSFKSILITMLSKKNFSTVLEFRSLRFQGHSYHEDGKRINLNFPHSAKNFLAKS